MLENHSHLQDLHVYKIPVRGSFSQFYTITALPSKNANFAPREISHCTYVLHYKLLLAYTSYVLHVPSYKNTCLDTYVHNYNNFRVSLFLLSITIVTYNYNKMYKSVYLIMFIEFVLST